MIYRIVNESRMNQVEELWDYCFEKKEEPFFKYYFQNYCGKDNMVIGGFEEVNNWERLCSMLHINPYMLRIRGTEQLTPYLVGIAVSPEARGSRQMESLLKMTFDVLRSQKFAFAMLMPINAGIYLPYDFAYICYRIGYDMPLTALHSTKAGNGMRMERTGLDKEILAPLYDSFMEGRNGVLRTDFQWRKLLAVHELEGTKCAAVSDQGAYKGYMFYNIKDECFNIVELAACDHIVRRKMLQYACGHRSEAKHFTWLADTEDMSYLELAEQKYTGALVPFMMARCIDARTALERLPASEDLEAGELTLLLIDKMIDRNNHLIKLRTAPGKLETATTAQNEDFAMDMGTFSQLYFGTFTAEELIGAGRIRCTDPEKILLLQKLFPKCRNFINEYF